MALLQKKRMNGKVIPSLGANLIEKRLLNPLDLLGWNEGLMDLGNTSNVPPANITESSSDYQIDICVPGMKRENFEVSTQNKILTVLCDAKAEKTDDKTHSKKKEFDYHQFSRSFLLPENILGEKVHAKYENGILNISIPKKEITSGKLKKSVPVK